MALAPRKDDQRPASPSEGTLVFSEEAIWQIVGVFLNGTNSVCLNDFEILKIVGLESMGCSKRHMV